MIECPLWEPFPKDTEILAYPIHEELPQIRCVADAARGVLRAAIDCFQRQNLYYRG